MTEWYKIVLAGANDTDVMKIIRRVCDDYASFTPYGKINIDREHLLYVFGAPKAHTNDPVWQSLVEEVLGFALVIDLSRPELVNDTTQLLKQLQQFWKTPLVGLVYNEHEPTSISLADMRILLRMSEDIPLIHFEMNQPDSIKQAFIRLMQFIQVLVESDTDLG